MARMSASWRTSLQLRARADEMQLRHPSYPHQHVDVEVEVDPLAPLLFREVNRAVAEIGLTTVNLAENVFGVTAAAGCFYFSRYDNEPVPVKVTGEFEIPFYEQDAVPSRVG